jgi:cathepsin B
LKRISISEPSILNAQAQSLTRVKIITKILIKENCSSSFAVASASAISDRYCFATKKNVRLSAQHFLSCQEDALGNECSGGSIASFLDFAKKKGIVDDQCFEYKGESNVACPEASLSKCERHYILDYCVASSIEGIKREILKNGPVIGYIPIYRDFLVYKGGIYNVLEGTSKFQGGHAVKIIGWGNSDGTDYWIVENSWGESWGIKGYAHVAVGQESLYLDEYVFAVNPKYEQESPKAKEEGKIKI